MTARRWMACMMLAVGVTVVPMATATSQRQRPTEAIVTVQVGLWALGYDPGPIDRFRGPRTFAALRAYAKDRRIVLNQATVDLVLALLHAEVHEQLVANGETGEPLDTIVLFPYTSSGLSGMRGVSPRDSAGPTDAACGGERLS